MTALLKWVPVLLLAVVFVVFGTMSDRFLDTANLTNILVQSASIAIVATGMTFVLLTAGIDLSVGAIMFLSAAVAGKLVLGGTSLYVAVFAVLAAGLAFGAVNAFFIARLRMLPFIITLATLFCGRGLGLRITETRAMNLPDELLRLGTGSLFGMPVPLWILAIVVSAASLVLSRTSFGRQVYAVGTDQNAARKAGIHVPRILTSVYLISGFLAALGGLVAVAQLGAVSPTFGNQREFAAISAAVLGGTSLFGGRGRVFPGTLLGAVLIQTIESGLVIVNADPYIYPLITASVIFFAVAIDTFRESRVRRLSARRIRPAA